MAKMRERREARQTGLLNTVAGQPSKTPGADLTDPEAPALKMPDPFDPKRREMLKGLVMSRLRGGRRGTILSGMLRKLMGTSRTATAE